MAHYVLEENGVRVATADRLDSRDHLVQTFVRSLVLPFALALVGVLLLTWWICTRSACSHCSVCATSWLNARRKTQGPSSQATTSRNWPRSSTA